MDYWIERDAKYKRVNHKNGKVSHQCPVKVKFYMIDEAGEEVDLSGAARFNSTYGTGTNEEIKKESVEKKDTSEKKSEKETLEEKK